MEQAERAPRIEEQAKRIAELIAPLRVEPNSSVTLAKDFDPGYKAGFLTKKDGVHLLRTGIAMLSYCEDLTFGIVADYDSSPDIDVLSDGIEQGVARLAGLAALRDSRERRKA